jgi:succinyl-CoA synthetase beta subunit
LTGLRGGKPRDMDALVRCVVRFSDFVARNAGRFTAVEMNPVMVRPEGEGVAVADALITVATTRRGDRRSPPIREPQ